ncbi:MAG: hypothetical protein U0103_29860 [Candidatus Obscuribacterales bacterium]
MKLPIPSITLFLANIIFFVPPCQCKEADLFKTANSLEPIPLKILKAVPKGNDALKVAYERIAESNDASKRYEIGRNYEQGIDAASHGDYKKAEHFYRTLIAKWKDCQEMPPLSQVQMALAQTLIKSGKQAEANEIENKFSARADADEKTLLKEVAEAKARFEKLPKNDVSAPIFRSYLASARRQLANFFLAEAKYEQAEECFKLAFHDVVSAYSRQAAEAKNISHDYATLLRLMGKSDQPAKDMLLSQSKGHEPVSLALTADRKFNKLGADKITIVLEDEYGAPSGAQWFTKKGFLQGYTGDTLLWKKPIVFSDFVNMDKCKVEPDGQGFKLFTRLGKLQVVFSYFFDGTKVVLKRKEETSAGLVE